MKKLFSHLPALISSCALIFVGTAAMAADYDHLEITPRKVGVLYNNPETRFQQFKAWGYKVGQAPVDITDQVDWYIDHTAYPHPEQDPSTGPVARIDANGKAMLLKSWGRVVVNACYPKGCKPGGMGGGSAIPFIVESLLAPSFEVTGTVDVKDGQGIISSGADQSVRKGRGAIFTFTPDDSTIEAAWVDEGGCPEGVFSEKGTKYTTGPISEACSVNFHFAAKPWLLITGTVDDINSHGTITPSQGQDIMKWESMTYTLTPTDNFYELRNIDTDCPTGTYAENNTKYTTGEITADCFVDAHFAAKPLVTASTSGGNGSMTPEGDNMPYPTGAPAHFTFTPEGGYQASVVSNTCGGSFSADKSTFTTAPVTADCTVDFEFVLIPVTPGKHMLTVVAVNDGDLNLGIGGVDSSPGGIECGTPEVILFTDCTEEYDDGTLVTLTAMTELDGVIGGSFAGWSGCTTSTNNSIIVTMDAAKTCTATFIDR